MANDEPTASSQEEPAETIRTSAAHAPGEALPHGAAERGLKRGDNSGKNAPGRDRAAPSWVLRRGEQTALGAVLFISLAIIAISWWRQGGYSGQLLDIDRTGRAEQSSAGAADASPEPGQRTARRPPRFLVDVNTADWPELTLLPAIGPTLARRIVESREKDGPYRSVQDLRRVRGIGPKTLETITPYILPLGPNAEVAQQDSPPH